MDPVVPSVFDEMEEQKPVYQVSNTQRLLNFLIDYAVRYGLVFLTGMLLAVLTELTGVNLISFLVNDGILNKLLQYLLGYIIFFLYYFIVEGASKGLSLGKLITGTKAVKEDGSDIDWKDALKRSACRIIPLEPLSSFGGGLWHDTIPKTMVIRTR